MTWQMALATMTSENLQQTLGDPPWSNADEGTVCRTVQRGMSVERDDVTTTLEGGRCQLALVFGALRKLSCHPLAWAKGRDQSARVFLAAPLGDASCKYQTSTLS